VSGARDRDFTPDQMAQMFLAYGDGMLKAMIAGGKAAVMVMSGHAVERELSFPKSGPPVFPGLRWQTGHLRRSVAASPEAHAVSEKEGEASFGTSVPYGIKHEQGWEGYEHVPQHIRRIKSRSLFARNDEGKRRKVAQGIAFVRAHERYATYPARRYLGRTLEADSPLADRLIDRAHWILLMTGTPPDAGEVISGGGAQ
jgi:hypothetical protein